MGVYSQLAHYTQDISNTISNPYFSNEMYIFIPYPYPTKQAFEAGTFHPHLIPD